MRIVNMYKLKRPLVTLISQFVVAIMATGCTEEPSLKGYEGEIGTGSATTYRAPKVDMQSYDIGRSLWPYSFEIIKELEYSESSSDCVAYLEANYVVKSEENDPQEFVKSVKEVQASGKKAIGRIYVSAGWAGIDDYLLSRGVTEEKWDQHRMKNMELTSLTGAAGGGKLYCANSPLIQDLWRKRARLCADARCDFYSVDFQELIPNAMEKFGGCFCQHCMYRFEAYLASIGVPLHRDMTPYNAKEPQTTGYIGLLRDFNISESQYKKEIFKPNLTNIPLAKEWRAFQSRVAREMHDLIIEAGSPQITVDNLFTSCDFYQHAAPYLTQPQLNYVTENYRYEPYEYPYEFLVAQAVAPKSISVTAHTEGSNGDWGSPARMKMRTALSTAYGVHFMNPTNDAIAGVVDSEVKDEIQSYYDFIERHNYLIDNFEPMAKVGFVYSTRAHAMLGESSSALISGMVSCLKNNLPVRAVLCDDTRELYSLPFKRDGLEAILADNAHMQYLLNPSKVLNTNISHSTIGALMANITPPIVVESSSKASLNSVINVVPRQSREGDISIHVVNMNYPESGARDVAVTYSDITIKLRVDDFVGTISECYLYTPEGGEPQKLNVSYKDGYNEISLPALNVWAIIRIDKEGSQSTNVSSVEVTPNQHTIRVGECFTPKVTLAPTSAIDKSVIWSSQNSSIATVDPATGEVTAIKEGNVNIIATSSNGISGSCSLAILAPIKVESIDISEKSRNLQETQSFTIDVAVTPANATNKSITFSSSNSSVAKVDSTTGEVTALNEGSARITATSLDGSHTSYCDIEVSPATLVSDFSLTNGNEITSGRIAQFAIQPLPTTATQQGYSISVPAAYSDFVKVIDSKKAVVAGLKEGAAKITITADDRGGYSKTIDVVVTRTSRYLVGDLYPNYEDAVGIVFQESKAGGKILSLAESHLAWSTNTRYIGECDDRNDGSANYKRLLSVVGSDLSEYPIFEWCDNLNKLSSKPAGVEWYIPSVYELGTQLSSDVDYINYAAEIFGKESPIRNEGGGVKYWSSTEYYEDGSKGFVSIFYKSQGNVANQDVKRNIRYVRAASHYEN